MHEFRKVFKPSAYQFVEDEHLEGLQKRERSSKLDELTVGKDSEFMLDYLYIMWLLRLGMMLYNIVTGWPYFDRKSPQEMTKLLCGEGCGVN